MKHLPKLLLWLPAALWYRVIWGFSAQTAAVSGDLSDRLLWRLMTALSPAFAAGDFPARNAAVELLSFFERKAAHMFLYFVLILLLWLALTPLLRGWQRQAGLAAVLCGALAGLDEVHQTFTPGRSGQPRDVAIDLAGAAVALILVAVLLWAAGRRREGRFTRLGWLLPGLWALLAVAVAALPVDFAALPPFAWAAERFVPEFPALDHTTQAALLAALSPMLRETCFLAICGLLGALSVLGAFLSARRPLCALTASLGLSLVLSGLPSLLWGLPALTATLLSALGWAVGVGLWLLCLAAKNVFSRVFASSEREKHLYKE